jgi:hypothetical protein
MRLRQVRLLGMPDARRGSEQLTFPQPLGDARRAAGPAAADVPLTKPDELSWWDWTVFLLHTAAEIEHALLVQYLYAVYSLAAGGFPGPSVPADAVRTVSMWRLTITEIAREEMAHFLTVQNLLRFIGGPLTLEREDFPFTSPLYPFPLKLEPLTRTSLAKYVAAEMPADPQEPAELIQEIITRAARGTGGLAVNRVGVVYETLTGIFADATKLADSDLRKDTMAQQASKEDWHAGSDTSPLIVRAVDSRDGAVDALQKIGAQGEGLANPQGSHFTHFLEIYRAFPETEGPPGTAPWVPTLAVPSNPNTLPDPSSDTELEQGRITHSTARLWAQLFNLRYRMLLTDLLHVLHLSYPSYTPDTAVTVRGHLRDWTFQEMVGLGSRAGLRGIAKALTALPLKQTPGPTDANKAGPPFEMPYTLTLPDQERDRWHLHLAQLDGADQLIGKIQARVGSSPVLDELTSIDQAMRAIVNDQLAQATTAAGPPGPPTGTGTTPGDGASG